MSVHFRMCHAGYHLFVPPDLLSILLHSALCLARLIQENHINKTSGHSSFSLGSANESLGRRDQGGYPPGSLSVRWSWVGYVPQSRIKVTDPGEPQLPPLILSDLGIVTLHPLLLASDCCTQSCGSHILYLPTHAVINSLFVNKLSWNHPNLGMPSVSCQELTVVITQEISHV